MNRTDLRVLANYTTELFNKWNPTTAELDAFMDALQYQPFEVAKEAVKRHWQQTKYVAPKCGAVMGICKDIRFGTRQAVPQNVVKSAPTDRELYGLPSDCPEFHVVIAKHAAQREKAAILYGDFEGARWYLVNGYPRLVPELKRAGLNEEQAQEVASKIKEMASEACESPEAGDTAGVQTSERSGNQRGSGVSLWDIAARLDEERKADGGTDGGAVGVRGEVQDGSWDEPA